MSNWLAGAKVIFGRDGGPMLGGPRKVVWHTTENDPTRTTAANVAHYLVGTGNTVHLVWNPDTDEIVQMIPANRAGRGLENHLGGVETNRAGAVVVQIEVVGRASQPFTSGPLLGLPKILAWLASLGIPPVWVGTENRSVANWAKAGHFGHMDVPENSHTDPGRVDKAKLAKAPAVTGSPVRGPFPLPVGKAYRVGSTGWGVYEIQQLVGAQPDRNYGPVTAAKVAAWTKAHGPYPSPSVNKQIWDFMSHYK